MTTSRRRALLRAADAAGVGHPAAELEAGALEACTTPDHIGGFITGRCHDCQSCRAHDKTMAHLSWLRWMVEAGHLDGDTLPPEMLT